MNDKTEPEKERRRNGDRRRVDDPVYAGPERRKGDRRRTGR
ncbi:hypothetical protein [Stakelama saccharophila]|uniref:30S ribosomal protein S5 n=1 Tax=Stakelama saccharophila TaxID=3075605 RepID=A0ABZ0BAH3_9SPHN|nr:hypothetical protein [Stakelama sp. W311]WNO54412.1 hypothetical protein RPR59_03925 [Stakelama sp. W311]